MFISQHLMFRSCLSEIVWFKLQINSSWRVPILTATSQRGTFPSIVLREYASISGKKLKALRGNCEGANYRMDQSCLRFCSAYHDNPTIRIVFIRKKFDHKERNLNISANLLLPSQLSPYGSGPASYSRTNNKVGINWKYIPAKQRL